MTRTVSIEKVPLNTIAKIIASTFDVKFSLLENDTHLIIEREDNIVERCHYFSLKIHALESKDEFRYSIEAKEGVLLPRNLKKYNNVIRFEDLKNLFVTWPSNLKSEDRKITLLSTVENRFILLEIDSLLKSLIIFGINKRKEEIERIKEERRRYFQTVHPGHTEKNEED